MKKMCKVILAAAAIVALAVPAMAAPGVPKLKVQDGTNATKFVVNDDGTVGLGVASTIYPLEMTSANATNVPAGVGSFMMNDTTNKGRFEVRSFGNVFAQGPTFQGKGAGWDGTQATVTLTDHVLFALGGNGVDTNGVVPSGNSALVKIKAESDWTTASHGTVITMETIPTGSLTRTEYLRINGNGVQVTNGGLVFAATTAAPTCDVTKRGMVYFTQGATGVKDSLQVCAKDAANAYAWRAIY